MKLLISNSEGDIVSLDVSDDMEIENLAALIQIEMGISYAIDIFHNGKLISSDVSTSLSSIGLTDSEILLVRPSASQSSNSRNTQSQPAARFPILPSSSTSDADLMTSLGSYINNPSALREMLLSNQDSLDALKMNNPILFDALHSSNTDTFDRLVRAQLQMASNQSASRSDTDMLCYDADTQKLIADHIQRSNIEANMCAAIEYNPESFATVSMLYIRCKVNGHEVVAFIDSGAQTTIMSSSCAERCNIMRLVDTRFQGVAQGVGTQPILGRVHVCQLQIGDAFLTSSFHILQDQPVDVLFGLDMLRRHQCVIDLKDNCLRIISSNTVAHFLDEAEHPNYAKMASMQTGISQEDEDIDRAIEESCKDVNNLSERDVQTIIKVGYSRSQAIQALRQYNGNLDQALAHLFAKSISSKQAKKC